MADFNFAPQTYPPQQANLMQQYSQYNQLAPRQEPQGGNQQPAYGQSAYGQYDQYNQQSPYGQYDQYNQLARRQEPQGGRRFSGYGWNRRHQGEGMPYGHGFPPGGGVPYNPNYPGVSGLPRDPGFGMPYAPAQGGLGPRGSGGGLY